MVVMTGTTGDFTDVMVVIPAFNEGAMIGQVVRAVRQSFPHVLVVDDGSTDDTAAVAREAGAHLAVHAINLGQGGALITGLKVAADLPSMRWIVTFDADGQHRVEDAAVMVKVARERDLDVVLGSRFTGGGTTNAGRLRRVVLKAATAYTRWSTGLPLTDTHNGLRVMSSEFAGRLTLKERGMGHASEILDQIADLSARWTEVPVAITYTDYSRSKGQSVSNAVNIMFDRLLG